MNGAEWLVQTLRERGVEVVFVLCGNGLKPFLDACVDSDMRVVDTRNEQSAAYMSDAWHQHPSHWFTCCEREFCQ